MLRYVELNSLVVESIIIESSQNLHFMIRSWLV